MELNKDTEVPPSIEIGSFVKDSVDEINAMMYLLENPTSGLSSRKRLPNHMRRRAMSHNIKRIPKRLRDTFKALRDKSNTKEGKNKVPRRLYRRRPKILSKEYDRRQKLNKWLETHIWHAKRFSMCTKWGFKIAEKPSDKSYRACYRATSNHCLAQDISFYSCLELSGSLDDILNFLEPHCNRKELEKLYLINGYREGTIFMYKKNLYPKGAIGEVKFIWSPNVDKKIWFWVHPSFINELMNELSIDLEKNKIKMRTVKMNRFRLLGPLSQSIISKMFIPVDNLNNWVKDFYKMETLIKQKEFWSKMKNYTSPAQLSPRIIVPISVYDTRMTAPKFRKKNANQYIDEECGKLDDLSSPMWDENMMERIINEKYSNKQINDIRSEQFVSGIQFETQISNNPSFPILAVQNPGCRSKLGFGCGWDIICPPGYGMAVWMSIILNGGRAGGLNESESHARESNDFNIHPDTRSGQETEQTIKNQLTEKHFRIPPAKRHNYIKLGIPTPFCSPWKILVQEWSAVDDFYVLRDNLILKQIINCVKNNNFNLNIIPGALIGIKLVYDGKGLLSNNAHICIPKDDLVPPVEPEHPDLNQTERQNCKTEHVKLLKSLSRKRKKNKDGSSDGVVEEHRDKMRSLWLPECSRIRDYCSREICGFVSNGDFCFTEAKSSGLGYITYDGLVKLCGIGSKNKVLIRTVNTLQYRFASFEICVK